MASQRRGRGRTPEFRGTLGTLWRTTVAQAGVVREVLASGARAALERGAREGRSRLDEVRAERRRDEALAELGETVLELVRAGEIELDELPEVQELVAELDAIDDEPNDGRRTYRNRDDVRGGAMPPSRSRFDDRDARDHHRDRSDGTVAATSTSTSGMPRRVPTTGIWRPVSGEPPVTTRGEDATAPRGGITFDDDDLADYMHPDDVPAKGADTPKDPHNES